MKTKITVIKLTDKEKSRMQNGIEYRVTKLGNIQVPPDRKIFLDKTNRFWYQTRISFFRYSTDFQGRQTFTVSGYKFVFTQNTFDIFEDKSPAGAKPLNAVIDINVGKSFRLKNGIKTNIVAFVKAGDCASQDTYIGVYRDGTIRFDVNGKLLSHAEKEDWSIDGEFTDKKIWVVVRKVNNDLKSEVFESENASKQFVEVVRKTPGYGVIVSQYSTLI